MSSLCPREATNKRMQSTCRALFFEADPASERMVSERGLSSIKPASAADARRVCIWIFLIYSENNN